MGDALVLGLVNGVLGKLTSVAFKEFRLVWGFNDNISTLENYFKQIQAVLHDAEKRRSKEETVELWLKRLRSESLKMENVFDKVATEAMLRKLHKELGIKYRVRAFFSSDHNQLMFHIRIAHKVKAIRKNIAEIAAQRYELNLTPAIGIISEDVDVGVCGEMPNRETSSLVHSSTIFGRNEETELVVKKICNKDIAGIVKKICYKDINKHDVVDDIRVYAIWGMGGLAKTTLAQLVYNHEKVKKHFELKCWMYVSENFEVKEIIKGLIESMDNSKCKLSQLDDLQRSLQEKVRRKRFLVVLDDVWVEENEKSEWDKLCTTLKCGAKGSIVMVTTRNQTTSRMIAQVPDLQHELGCLSKEDSWSLFEKLAFAEGREGGDRRELEPIGMELVKKCKGLPLAVKTLGSLMWSKSSTSDWERVKGNETWQLHVNDVLPALKLSYDNLLPHIKRCFSYCCLFPKGYEMKKDLLILLWKANGFISPRGEANEYAIGEEVYNYLVWRSFFQFVDEKYKMHDLMHDLAEFVMGHDCLIIEPGKKVITLENVLHLSSSFSEFDFSKKDLESLRSLRSIFIFHQDSDNDHIFNEYNDDYHFSQIFDLVYLRVLLLVNLRSSKLPESIGNLKYLKYMNLSDSKIEELPKSIIYLQNLLVLILERCEYLRTLQEGIRYMKNLQHLNIKHCFKLKYLPVGILKGVNDVRLTHFPVGEKEGAKIGELGDLINLVGGELEISGLENVERGLTEAKNANLKSKTNLLNLRLVWGSGYRKIGHDEEVLEGLEPNPCLKELVIYEYNGKNISPSWILNLNNLVKINFYYCRNCENIPPLGKLPSLRVIELFGMDSLKCFNDEDNTTSSSTTTTTTTTHLSWMDSLKWFNNDKDTTTITTNLFPSLQELDISYNLNLVSLPSYFPKLKYLFIMSCESLTSLPDEIQSFKDLDSLVIHGCEKLRIRYEKENGVDWPKISHIRSVHIARE